MGLILYHSVESTCAQKVRLVLSEKKLPWEELRLNLRKGDQFAPEYLKLNPKAVVPTLVEGDCVVCESTVINEYIEDRFPEPGMRPANPGNRAQMRLFVKRFDEEVHPSVGILTYAIMMRHQMNELKTPAELQQHFERIVDPGRRERQRSTHELGLKAAPVPPALQTLDRIVASMESVLTGNCWLGGDDYSLADAAATPYMVRIEGLHLGRLWEQRPHVRDWLAASRGRRNCLDLEDPWGGTAFTEMMEHYASAADAEIEHLLSGPG